MGLERRGILASEATVFDAQLKWLRYREKERVRNHQTGNYQRSLWFPMKNWADTDHIRKTRRNIYTTEA